MHGTTTTGASPRAARLAAAAALVALASVLGCGAGAHTAPAIDDCALDDCSGGGSGGGGTGPYCGAHATFPPAVPLQPPATPACCSSGFEIGDAHKGAVYVVTSLDPHGATGGPIDVQVATYEQADEVAVERVDATGAVSTLFDTCRIQTWNQGDATGGKTRPVDASIRQFTVQVPPGTTALRFDFAGVGSPMYLQVLGLCEFDVERTMDAVSWRAVAESSDACAPGHEDAGDASDAGDAADGALADTGPVH